MLDIVLPRALYHAFQSTPDREAGRCTIGLQTGDGGVAFQSTPDREAGRCTALSRSRSPCKTFQSTPDREAGRCAAHGEAEHDRQCVSIHARP